MIAFLRRLSIPGCVLAAWLMGHACLSAAGESDKTALFIAGTKSHGPGHHEYERGLRLLARALDSSPNVRGLKTEIATDGWPLDETVLDRAATIILFCDGSDRDEQAHPLLRGERLARIDSLMRKGVGLVAIHYTVFVPLERGGGRFLEWIGGFFDYESGDTPNRWHSRISTQTTRPVPATPGHPICRGLAPFDLTEEYYHNIRFRDADPLPVPILKTPITGEAEDQIVAWAVERTDGGRGFGFTGGHFHANWGVENFRRMVLNAIVWTARMEVPAGGVDSPAPTAEELAPGIAK
jgi:type 1 glutamine amidotransferase